MGPTPDAADNFHFPLNIFPAALPDGAVTVSAHWHYDLLGRKTLLADVVAPSFTLSQFFSPFSSGKVNPLVFLFFFPPLQHLVLFLFD